MEKPNRNFSDTVYTAQLLQCLLCNLCNTCYCHSLWLCDSSGYVVPYWTFNMHLFIYLWPYMYCLLNHFSISCVTFSSSMYTLYHSTYGHFVKWIYWKYLLPLYDRERKIQRNRYPPVLPIYWKDYFSPLSIKTMFQDLPPPPSHGYLKPCG